MAKPRKQTTQTNTATAQPAVKETSAQIFVRLGEPRLAAALSRIRILKQTARYEHTERQGEKVMALIDAAVDELRTSFGPKTTIASEVSLKDV